MNLTLQQCKDKVGIQGPPDFYHIARQIISIPDNLPIHSADHKLKQTVDILEYVFNSMKKQIEAAELYRQSANEWIRFEDARPAIDQEIWIVWPSGTIEPEWRKWTKQMDDSDWSLMRWLPVPNYQPEPPKI